MSDHDTSSSRACHLYTLFGRLVESSRALPLFSAATTPAARASDIRVSIDLGPPSIGNTFDPRSEFNACDDGTVEFTRPNGFRATIEASGRLSVRMPEDLTDGELQACLSGPVLAAYWHLVGLPPLHASAISIDGRAVLVVGRSGYGKSTLVRAMLDRGHQLLSDDQSQIDIDAGLALAGYPSMKLWATTAASFGDSLNSGSRVSRYRDKYHFSVADRFDAHPRHLSHIVFLVPARELAEPMMERLPPSSAAAALHRHTYRLALAQSLDGGRRALDRATAISQRIPCLVLRRPDDLSRIPGLCERLEDPLRTN